MIPALNEILAEMAAKVPEARAAYGAGLCADSLADTDYFLATARSLLSGAAVKTTLNQDERVARTLAACERLQIEEFDLFGKERKVDFSQFKPRGHYTKEFPAVWGGSLANYFRTMLWLGRVDLLA